MRVVAIGGLNMDLVVRVAALPRAGETVEGEDLLRAAGGKGGNQAVAAARLGASVEMIGRIGRDAFGHELTSKLRDAGVSSRWVLGCDRPTGAALIFVDAKGENSIAVAPGANHSLLPEDIPRRVVESTDMVMAALEVSVAAIEEAFRLARLAGVHTVLNAAPAQQLPKSLLSLSDVIICNEVELSSLLGRTIPVGKEAAAAHDLRSFPEQIVVVTLGARGAVAVSGDAVLEQPAFAVEVLDTTGAGDAFVGGFVVGDWISNGVANALRWGCAAGSLATTRHGAQPSMPSLAEVQALLEHER
jgi:ribokinase